MKSVTRLALLLGAALSLPAVAGAQATQLSKQERTALSAVQTAMQARDYATAAGAITTAKSQAQSAYGHYLASSYELQLAMQTNNRAMQATAIDAMISSGAAPASSMEELYKNKGALALAAGRLDQAEAAFGKWAELSPNNIDAMLALAEVKDDRKKVNEAVTLIDRAIDARKAAGQPVPESWYKRGLKHAFDAKLAAPSLKFATGLVSAYPSPQNWRDALLVYRDIGQPDPQAKLDMMRLMRSSKALSGERDYLAMASLLSDEKLPAESHAVLQEGVSAKMVDAGKGEYKTLLANTDKRAAGDKKALAGLDKKAESGKDGQAALMAADNHFAFGDYAKAAEYYAMAKTKGGVDAGLVDTRLGMAQALGGQRAAAETTLRGVTGPRATLASYWLVWLANGGRTA